MASSIHHPTSSAHRVRPDPRASDAFAVAALANLALKPLLEPNVTVSQVLHRDSLESACELLVPHVVVVVDENDQDTRDTLMLLRRILPGLSPSIALLGRDLRPLDRHVSYDVALAFDADTPIEDVADAIAHAARQAALDAPRVLIVDENGTHQDAVDGVHRMGGHAIVVRNPAQVREVMEEVQLDAILLSPSYHHVSGFDVCRSIRTQSRVPILFIADHADQGTRYEAFRAGANDLIALPWVVAEVQKRIQQLVELHRLRGTTFQVDRITGTKHVSALEHGLREIATRVGGTSLISMAAFEVCGFAELRTKHGETSARTVLRHVADSLTSHFDGAYVYRGWGERFFVLTDTVLPEDPAATPWAPILELSRVTFRDLNGRGFYASLNVGQLIAPVEQVSANGCVEGLLRILSRCRALGSAQMMTARVETQSNHVPERDARASIRSGSGGRSS
ncbi:MAG: response regulator [bacterium]